MSVHKQFGKDFFKPNNVIAQIIEGYNLFGKVVLEPSAGKGNMVDYFKNEGANVIAFKKCTIEGNILRLPSLSDGPLVNYSDVKKALLNAGAKYKKNTFVFPSDAQSIIDKLTGGEVINLKKEFQFFPTPDRLADRLVDLAEITGYETILEPSAGHGSIIKALKRKVRDIIVHYCEILDTNRDILNTMRNTDFICADFLQIHHLSTFDRIIANPPFTKNQDIAHIQKMYDSLNPGGIMVSMCSTHYKFSQNKTELHFAGWLAKHKAEIFEVEAGAFKESGTSIPTVIIKIKK